MTTYAPAKWFRVTRRNLCPICQRPDWCVFTDDGAAAICMRMSEGSLREVDCEGAGVGYLHRLIDSPQPMRLPPRLPSVYVGPTVDWRTMIDRFVRQTKPPALRAMAYKLGLTIVSLERMGCCRAPEHKAWAFPMYDARAEIIGIRLRGDDGRKWCIPGSHNGLFLPDGFVGEQASRLYVVEGPTDCAALLDLGLYGVGRPSNSGGAAMLVPVLRGLDVVILADKDPPKSLPDGKTWVPGQFGAERLAAELHGKAASVKIIYPLVGKDARDWLRAGATGAVVESVAKNTGEWKLTPASPGKGD